MTLLSIIQTLCSRLAIVQPTVVVGSTDQQVIQLLGLANEEGQDLAARGRWEKLQNESTFTTVATESQGAMTTLAGADFGWICDDTIWNRSQNRPILPVDPIRWQQMKAASVTGPYTSMRIRGGEFLAYPLMTAGQTVAFEWISKNWCESSGGTGQSEWAADTDVPIVPGDLMTLGLIWRWKQAKGLTYAEDFATYERQVTDAMTRDGIKPQLNMGGGNGTRFLNRSSVIDGNWSM